MNKKLLVDVRPFEISRQKIDESINCVNKFCLNESKQTDDNSVVQLLRYYELDKELSKI